MKKRPDLKQKVETKLQEWKTLELKHKAKFLSFWAKASQALPKTNNESEQRLTSEDSMVQTTENKESPSAPSTIQDIQE